MVAGSFLFVLAAWIAASAHTGYHRRAMPIIWSGGINPLVFDRDRSPIGYWGAAVVNVMLAAGLALAGILMLAVR